MMNTATAPRVRPNISTFRRALWHVNRTDLGWVVKGVLSALNSTTLAARRRQAETLPTSPALAAAAVHLREFGFADVTAVMSRALAEAVARHAGEKIARAEALVAKQQLGHKAFWVSLLDEDLDAGAFPSDHPFVRFALQPEALRILADHMGILPQLSDVLLTLSRPTAEGASLSYSQLWHLDHDDKTVCKLFIYLSDVETDDDGPFTFMDAKASAPFRNRVKSHLTDEVVLGVTGPGAPRKMIAPKLTCFIVDTAHCLHMGSRIRPGHQRLLYTATFFPPPRIYPEPPPRFFARGPLSPIERAVLAV